MSWYFKMISTDLVSYKNKEQILIILRKFIIMTLLYDYLFLSLITLTEIGKS